MAAQSPLLTCCHCSLLRGRSPDLHGKIHTHTREPYKAVATLLIRSGSKHAPALIRKKVYLYTNHRAGFWRHLADCQQQSMR